MAIKSRLININLNRRNWEIVMEALDSPDGFGEDHEPSLSIAVEIAKQLDLWCDSSAKKHQMIQPDDTETIQWGDYGICVFCHVVRQMPETREGVVFGEG